jgi:hypothetical protein
MGYRELLNDKTTIMDLNPIYGGSFNMSYKGFDFNLMFQEHRAMIFAAYHQPSRPITNKSIKFSTIDGCQEKQMQNIQVQQ